MRIWAHRGCSSRFPENTLTAFREACRYDIAGIELDVHMTKDRKLAVIHDETVDRTLEGSGQIREFTLAELQALPVRGTRERVPSLEEVLELMREDCLSRGLKINIEIKTDKVRYPGIEAMTVSMVRSYGLMDHVVFSSFNPYSLLLVRRADRHADIGILAEKLSWCIRISRVVRAKALHPKLAGLDRDIRASVRRGLAVRVWCGTPVELLYPDPPDFPALDLAELSERGVTDLFTNVPERYCGPALSL